MVNLIEEPRTFAHGVNASEYEQQARERAVRRGVRLACAVVDRYGTRDVYVIAARAGVRIVRRRWVLVTAGECDHARREIAVNLAAVERAAEMHEDVTPDAVERLIVAHELGHLFDVAWHAARPHDERRYDEESAHAFAAELLKDTIEIQAVRGAVSASPQVS